MSAPPLFILQISIRQAWIMVMRWEVPRQPRHRWHTPLAASRKELDQLCEPVQDISFLRTLRPITPAELFAVEWVSGSLPFWHLIKTAAAAVSRPSSIPPAYATLGRYVIVSLLFAYKSHKVSCDTCTVHACMIQLHSKLNRRDAQDYLTQKSRYWLCGTRIGFANKEKILFFFR